MNENVGGLQSRIRHTTSPNHGTGIEKHRCIHSEHPLCFQFAMNQNSSQLSFAVGIFNEHLRVAINIYGDSRDRFNSFSNRKAQQPKSAMPSGERRNWVRNNRHIKISYGRRPDGESDSDYQQLQLGRAGRQGFAGYRFKLPIYILNT